MFLRTILIRALALAFIAVSAPAVAQEGPAKRLANVVGVAIEEYAKAVDPGGRLISDIEYQETVEFLQQAREVASRMSGQDAAAARALLDTLVAAVAARRSPADLNAIHARFAAALGHEGRLDLPTRAVDLAAGQALFERSCASCHGARGQGGGPAATGMKPPPPAIGTRDAMHDVSPALMYRVISVGVAGTPMTGWENTLTPDDRWNIVAYLNSLRATPQQVAEGEGLYALHCSGCHGATGSSDGALAASLSKLPPELASFGWQAQRSDSQIAAAIHAGMPGTAMPAARALSDGEITSIIAFSRTLAGRTPPIVASAAGATDADSIARSVMQLVDEALSAARGGRATEAGDRAFDAYLAFEPLETPARARNPGLVARLERQFADFKGAVKANDVRRAEGARNAIEASLPNVVALTHRASTGWSAFFESFLIILREGFEAILVIGAVVAFLIKTGNSHRLRAIWMGVAAGIVASLISAVVLATVLATLPATREVIEGLTMLVAVGVLFSVSYWLISKVEAAKWQQFIREKVSAALATGGGKALAFVAFLAVYREGAETVLFYQALFAESAANVVPLTLGIVVGGVALTVIFVLFHRFGVKIPLRPFFGATSVLLYYLAFVFMGKGLSELQEGNVISQTTIPGFPQIPAMGIFASVETLLGQLLLVVLFLFALVKTFWPRRAVALPTITAQAPAPAPPVAAAPSPELMARVSELSERLRELQGKVDELESLTGIQAEHGTRR